MVVRKLLPSWHRRLDHYMGITGHSSGILRTAYCLYPGDRFLLTGPTTHPPAEVCCLASIRSVMGRPQRSRTLSNQRCWSLHSRGRPAVPAYAPWSTLLYSMWCSMAKRCSSLLYHMCVRGQGKVWHWILIVQYSTIKSLEKQTNKNCICILFNEPYFPYYWVDFDDPIHVYILCARN